MARFDLTDFEWSVIQPLLPNKSRGVPRVDDRRVLNGIFWRLRTGAPWADIPERYGPYTTCVIRFNRWRRHDDDRGESCVRCVEWRRFRGVQRGQRRQTLERKADGRIRESRVLHARRQGICFGARRTPRQGAALYVHARWECRRAAAAIVGYSGARASRRSSVTQGAEP